MGKLLILQMSRKQLPSVRTTLIVGSKIINSERRYCEQLNISNDVDVLLGGAHLTAVLMSTFSTKVHHFLILLLEIFANLVSYNALATQLPELSPVNNLSCLIASGSVQPGLTL
jgi:hypothetical protein